MAQQDVYFAADTSDKLVERLAQRASAYRDWLARTGRLGRMQRAWSAYYGGSVDGSKDTAGILTGGEQGELSLLTANMFGVTVRQVMRLITGQKPAFKVVAKTSDADSIAQATLGDALLEHYDKKANVSEREVDSVQSGMLLGSGWVVLSWSTQLGEEIGLNPDTGKVIREGDVSVRAATPWDVVHDVEDAPESRQWVAVRGKRKRHDLAAQFPALADEIRKASGDALDSEGFAATKRWSGWRGEGDATDEDNVSVWEFRHIPTPALPAGRLVVFCNSDCVLYDSAAAPMAGEVGEDGVPMEATGDAGYPYPSLLCEEFAPERRAGRASETHSSHWDALSLQEALDMVTTAITTNANIGSLVNLWVPPGSAPSIQRLDTGLNLVESVGKPEKIDTLALPPELVNLGGMYRDMMQQVAGLNDVVMGDTPSGMPAQLAALLEAKAVQFHAQGQANYYRLVESVRTGVLTLLQKFSTSPRTASLAGRANSWALKTWSADSLNKLDRVAVEPVNPVMRTFAGRMAFADNLAERGWIGLDQYTGVWLTGELHTEMDPRRARLGRIAREKEMLMRGIGLPPVDMAASMQSGEPVFTAGEEGGEYIRPVIAQKHWLDVPEYLSVLESPEALESPRVVQAVLDLVQEKLRLWAAMPMDMLVLLGGQPAPSTQMLAGPPPPGPEGGGGDAPGAPKAAAIAGEASPDVKMPAPPPNPLTGEQAPPPVGPVPV